MALSKTSKVILIVGGTLLVLFLLGIIGVAILVESINKPTVAKNSVLVLNISGDLPDYTPEEPYAKAFGISQKQSFTSLLTALRKAKVDNRIKGIQLNISFPGIGWAKADELRDAIKDFRTTSKPVYAYMDIGSNKEYYIATAADKIFVPPPGDLYINGFAAEAMFYKGSLDKLGIETDVIQFGPKYKNAPDQYTKTQMGDGQREVINALLNEYEKRYDEAIAESRKKSVDDVRDLVNNAPYNATQAKAKGLIDDALYPEQVEAAFKNDLGYAANDKLNYMRAGEYREISADSLGLNKGEKIAVIFASGAITGGRSSDGPFSGNMVGSDTIVEAVNDAANDSSVKAIVLRVDSPGGSALASDLMWNALENAKAKKPVVVSMSDVAASGGYYIACNANKIVAEPSTITGSIGLFLGKPVVKGLYSWLGISNEYVTRGNNAGIFKETEHWTDAERKKMYDQAHATYFDNFVGKVAKGRNMTPEAVDAIGEGHVWTGTQGKGNGLVDEFGGLEKAVDVAKQLAGLPADKDVKRVVFPAPRPFFETFFNNNDDDSSDAKERQAQEAILASLPEDSRRVFRYARIFDQMKHGETMLMMPYDLNIK